MELSGGEGRGGEGRGGNGYGREGSGGERRGGKGREAEGRGGERRRVAKLCTCISDECLRMSSSYCAGIPGGIVCVTLVDRLEGDQVCSNAICTASTK